MRGTFQGRSCIQVVGSISAFLLILPPFGILDETGSPQEILRKLFSADPRMKVTQEGNIIRMMETVVPTDMMNLKIHHVSFFPADAAALHTG